MKLKYILIIVFFLCGIKLFPQVPTVVYGEAMNDFAREAYSSAYQKFQEYSKLPDVTTGQLSAACYFSGECLFKNGDFSGAIFAYSKVADYYRLSNFREEAIFKLGLVYNKTENYGKSRERLFQLLSEFPSTDYKGQAYYWIAEDFLAEQIYSEAFDFFAKSAESKTDNPWLTTAIFKMANIHELRGDYDKAIDMYDTLLTYFRNSPYALEAQYRIGYSYFKLKMFDNALIELSNPDLAALPPENAKEASFVLGVSWFSTSEYGKADSIFTSLLKNEVPDSLKRQLLYSLGWCKFQEKLYTEAQKLFNTLALGTDSLARVSLYWKGEAQRYQGKQSEAIKTFEDYIKKYPRTALSRAAQYEIGVIYFEQQQFQKARGFLLNASSTGESDLRARIFTILGELELNRDNSKAAITSFTSALEIDSISKSYKNRAQFGLGVAQFKNGDLKKAIKTLQLVEKAAPSFETDKINFILGECYFSEDNYSAALARYKKLSPGNEDFGASGVYGAAYCSYNMKDYENAAYAFSDFVKNFPHDYRVTDARLRLADSYLATKKYQQAIAEYKELTKSTAKNNDYALYQSGLALYKGGKVQDAITQLKRLADKFPHSQYAENGLYLMAWMKLQSGNQADAIQQYEYLLGTYPNTKLAPQIYYAIGDCYYNGGNYDTAIVYYEKVVENYPNSSNAYDAINGIQQAYAAKGDVQSAADVIEKYSQNNKWSYADQLYLKKGELYFNQGNFQAAKESYESFVDLYPKSKFMPRALYWIGKSAQFLGNTDVATEKFSLVFSMYPKSEESASAVIEWGKILVSQKRLDEALKIYENGLERLKESAAVPEILYWKGIAEKQKGDEASAFDTFDQLVVYHDGTLFADKARIELGLIELNAKRYPNAIKYFQQLATKRNDEIGASAQYYLGVVSQRQEKFQEAITYLVRTLNSFTGFDEWVTKSYLRLGECYDKLKDTKKAREMYKTVVEKHKNDEYGKEAQAKIRRLR